MKRYLISLALAAGITATASSAIAAPPERFNFTDLGLLDPAYEDCTSAGIKKPVEGSASGKAKDIRTGAGSIISISPGAKVTYRNPLNERTLTYVITGSSHITSEQISTDPVIRRETVRVTGRNLLTRTLEQEGIYITIGNFSFVRTVNEMGPGPEDDVVTIVEEFDFNGPGQVINVCDALA
jgi:hypothetical protein